MLTVVPAFRDRSSWYYGLSAYWFATSAKWFILLFLILPGQVEQLVPGGEKSAAWGSVIAIGAAWASIGPSLFGYLSDRLLSRLGDRRAFISLGAGLTVIALMVLMRADSLAALTLGYLFLQVSDDIGTGPYSALIPELVPEDHRGRASGVMGMLNLAAQLAIGVYALIVRENPQVIYISLALVNVICALIVLGTLRGAVPVTPVAPTTGSISLRAFVQGWIKPWRNRDFFWVWFTRFLNAFGFYLVASYLQFYLGDIVRVFEIGPLKLSSPGQAVIVLVLVISVSGAIGAAVASRSADRIGRKPLVYASGYIMGATLIPFILIPRFEVIMPLAAVFGIGYGLYLSADWALVSDVLAGETQIAQSMGVWAMSVTAPQLIAGITGRLVDAGNAYRPGYGYLISFGVAAVSFVMSTVLVRQIRGSR